MEAWGGLWEWRAPLDLLLRLYEHEERREAALKVHLPPSEDGVCLVSGGLREAKEQVALGRVDSIAPA
jgi:hypothetical protein